MNRKNVLLIVVFIAIIALGAASSAGLFTGDDGKNGVPILASGHYEVGKNLTPGEYYVYCDNFNNLYIEVANDTSNSNESVIYNLNTDRGVFITVESGEFLEIDGGEIFELNSTPYIGPDNGTYKGGMYRVGEDIPAGEYEVTTVESSAYLEITNSSRHIAGDIIESLYFHNSTNITLEEGQYLLLSNSARIEIPV